MKKNSKKVAIMTIQDNENCGNRLQNYALQEAIKNEGLEVFTIKNSVLLNSRERYLWGVLMYIRHVLGDIKRRKSTRRFRAFNKRIAYTKRIYTCKSNKLNNKFDYFIAGSDQIWKPTRRRLSYMDLLGFADSNKRVSYAASFGISSIDEAAKEKLRNELPKFKAISVREDAGAKIIEDATGIKTAQVVLDPTMLVSEKDWSKLEKRPETLKSKKYALTYFLGDNTSKELSDYCAAKNLDIVDFYRASEKYGPSEFLYLIHHADLIITDSFHGTVFSIIFNRPFLICKRQEKAINNDMYSRIETLLGKFGLEKQMYDGKIDESKLSIDYAKVNETLKKEQKKSLDFLKKALDIRE